MTGTLWTVALVATGVGGLWCMAKHWWGWGIYTANEVLWFAYAVRTGDTPLTIMAVIWFALGLRGFCVAYRRHCERQQVQRIAQAPTPW